MGSGRFKTFLSICFLLLFTSARGLSYHPLTHTTDENQIRCELCDHVLLSELTQELDSGTSDFEIHTLGIIPDERPVILPEVLAKVIRKACLFGRPPPMLA